jgi:hypothetical protein
MKRLQLTANLNRESCIFDPISAESSANNLLNLFICQERVTIIR